MPLGSTILALNPTSYWPLDDAPGSASCLDVMGLTNATLPAAGGVTLAAIPFGASSAPSFDGAIGSRLTIASAPQYSQPFAKALTVAVWILPESTALARRDRLDVDAGHRRSASGAEVAQLRLTAAFGGATITAHLTCLTAELPASVAACFFDSVT